MRWRTSLVLIGMIYSTAGWWARPGVAQDLSGRVNEALPRLLATYRQLHAAPELSYHEARTSALLAARLQELGYEVHTGVGRYAQPGLTACGVVAVLRNGDGPRVLVRTDMDALPVVEQTGLPYASTAKTTNAAGEAVGVAHACGHDVHMAVFLGTAELLAQLKDRWRGTVLLIGQPAEEIATGARAMLADRLYERFGRPDFALALHDDPEVAAGSVGYVSGFAMAAYTSLDLIVRGIGTHGARPEAGKDPIVLAAQIITALQTIVSREISPLEQVVVTVGAIQGGTKRNIIPEQVTMLLTVRTYKAEVRERVIAAIQRIARFTAWAAGLPEDRLPEVIVHAEEELPATYNDPALTARLVRAFQAELGTGRVHAIPPTMTSEDFAHFRLDGRIPSLLYRLGASDPAALAQARETVSPCQPCIRPCLRRCRDRRSRRAFAR